MAARRLIAEVAESLIGRSGVTGVLDDVEVPLEVGVEAAGVVVVAVGLSVLLEASFTALLVADVAGVAAGTDVSLKEKLFVVDDEVVEGNVAGTAPELPVRPSQRPWHPVIVLVVAPLGSRPFTVVLALVAVLVAVVPVVVVPVVVVPVVVVPAVVVVPVVVVPAVVVVPVVVSFRWCVVPVVAVPVVVVPVVVVPVVVVPAVVVVPVVVVPVVVVPVVVVPVVVVTVLTGFDGATLSPAPSAADAFEDVEVVGVVDVVVVVVAAGAVEVVAAGVVAIGASVTAVDVAAVWAACVLGRIASTSCSGERWSSASPASLASIRASRT